MTFQSHAQSGQDIFARTILEATPGWIAGGFIDIGANHPTERSNTYALEQLGWRGLLVDTDDYCVKLCREQRASAVVQADGATLDWAKALTDAGLPMSVSYLSLDCDAATPAVLRRLIDCGVRWKVATIEHDSYRFGPDPKREINLMMTGEGYFLLCDDVHDQGMPFEDWWVCDKLFEQPEVLKFSSIGLDWREVLRRGGIAI